MKDIGIMHSMTERRSVFVNYKRDYCQKVSFLKFLTTFKIINICEGSKVDYVECRESNKKVYEKNIRNNLLNILIHASKNSET